QAEMDYAKALESQTMVAISLMDGFLACWDEKFRSNRIRPVTVIHKYIDPNWGPLRQTPPVPEDMSRHSTSSSAAAVVSSYSLLDDLAYTDAAQASFGQAASPFD